MTDSCSLADYLLILNPEAADDPRFSAFSHSLIYLVTHSHAGSLGVNFCQYYRKTARDLPELHPELPTIDASHLLCPNLIYGGPVDTPPWVLQPGSSHWQNGFSNHSLSLGFSEDAFQALGRGDSRALVGVGVTSWGALQLEQELSTGLWQIYPCNYEVLTAIPLNDPPLYAFHQFLKLRFGKSPVSVLPPIHKMKRSSS